MSISSSNRIPEGTTVRILSGIFRDDEGIIQAPGNVEALQRWDYFVRLSDGGLSGFNIHEFTVIQPVAPRVQDATYTQGHMDAIIDQLTTDRDYWRNTAKGFEAGVQLAHKREDIAKVELRKARKQIHELVEKLMVHTALYRVQEGTSGAVNIRYFEHQDDATAYFLSEARTPCFLDQRGIASGSWNTVQSKW